jgi:glycosyltransferase
MKITVITVTYNSAATIVDTLQSVARQDHRDIEHLVIDGGSTDDTLALVAAHGGHVAQVVSEPDRGIYDAMNKGLRLAAGDLVGFLNSDDVFGSPATLSSVARAAEAGRADAVFGDLILFDPSRNGAVVRYWRSGEFSLPKVRFGWMAPHPTLYVQREVIRRIGLFDPDLRIAGDYDFMLRLFKLPGVCVAYLPEVLVRMRAGGASQRSLRAMMRKSSEDLLALRRHGAGGVVTLVCKNLRKLPMFFARPPA